MKSACLHLLAPAKLNLFLEVIAKRPDGFHEIRTVMHAVALCDEIVLTERKQGIRLESSDPSLPADERNLAWRAAALMQSRAGTSLGVSIRLTKKIPVGAGLGGGSSDAAAVLKGLNELWRLGLSQCELMALAAQLGSDCAFFIPCGTALCEGRGEIVKPIPCAAPLSFLLLCPALSVSTAEVYGNLTRNDLTGPRRVDSITQESLKTGDMTALGRALFNRLEGPAFRLYSELDVLKKRLLAVCPRGALMTGSGSALFGIFGDDVAEAFRAAARAFPSGQGRLCAVESFGTGSASRPRGGGCREHYRGAGPVA